MEMKTVYDLFSILSASLNKKELTSVASFDLSELYILSKDHSLLSSVYMALEPYENQISDKELFSIWKSEKTKSVFKQLEFDIEREAILSFLSSIGCYHMSLKGVLLKELYPDPFMREMNDNDIFFDKSYSNQLEEFMHSRGYTACLDKSKDDVYDKPPFYKFEMHRALIEPAEDAVFVDYYSDIKSRLIADENDSFALSFTDEDFYIFMILHAYLHYKVGGIGIRVFVDCYVYLMAKGESLDFDYISGELNILGINEFESNVRTMSLKLLSDTDKQELNEREKSILSYSLSSKTHGTWENYINNSLHKNGDRITKASKLRYLWKRVFLSKALMKSKYPWIRKHPWLLPIGYIHRIFVKGASDSKRLIKEAKDIWKR